MVAHPHCVLICIVHPQVTGNTLSIYTVNHKKRWQYICDHNFGKSRSIFIIFALMYRGRNVLLIYEKNVHLA